MENIDKRISILEERIGNHKDQLGRLVSHFESERDLSRERGMRVTSLEKTVEIIDKIVRNSGHGLGLRVDRLEQASSGNKYRLITIISILSALVSIGGFVLQLIRR